MTSAVEQAFDATGTLSIADAMIDTGGGTTMPSISVTLPPNTSLIVSAHDDTGPELAILQVGGLSLTGTLTVRGQRPLVVIAWDSITILGTIDGNASRGTPGPGGYGAEAGPGKGANGTTGSDFNDGGAGGGGFGLAGGAGQASGDAPAGQGGLPYGTPNLVVLEGGSGGGGMSPPGHCVDRPAGAGGGAIQLYSRSTITIDGAVMVNGGGGSGAGTAGGGLCNGWSVSATGGGSGGAIYLQASMVTGAGSLLAQGGAGGGGSYYNNSTGGGDGENGLTTIAAAQGGMGAGTAAGASNRGANGAYRDGAPSVLAALSGLYDTGGGGGGGVGRIVIRAGTSTPLQCSPVAAIAMN